MTRRTNDNPIGENWIKKETVDEWKRSAIKTLEKAKKFESEHEFKPVRVDGKTTILKLIK